MAQPPERCIERLGPVTHPILYLGSQLRERLRLTFRHKHRIVAEAVDPSGLLNNRAFTSPVEVRQQFAVPRDGNDTAKPRRTEFDPGELGQEQFQVIPIARPVPGKSRGAHPGRAAERIDLQAGIVRHDQRPVLKMSRGRHSFQRRVIQKSRPGFFHFRKITVSRQVLHTERPAQHRGEFNRFVAVTSGNKKVLHPSIATAIPRAIQPRTAALFHPPPCQVDAPSTGGYDKPMSDSVLAVFSDVHSNLEALNAVLAEMDATGVDQRVCLGDIVGYAANPAECLERVRALGCPIIQGNHDEAVASNSKLEGISETAKGGMEFARAQLTPGQREYLSDLPLTLLDLKEGRQFVHASLDVPEEWWYVHRPEDALLHFQAQTQPICFCGHTHVPFVWHCDDSGRITVAEGKGVITLPRHGKVLINAGSVGQPRDRCPDACYVIFDPVAHRAEFRRVPYDIEKAQSKILAAGLPRFAAQRLALGK